MNEGVRETNDSETSQLGVNGNVGYEKQGLFEALGDVEFETTISADDAKKVESWINMQNRERGCNMIEKTASEIVAQSKINGCLCLKIDGNIIGFINLMSFSLHGNSIYEWSSFIIEKKYRDKGLGKMLLNKLFELKSDVPMYCVTSSRRVKHILESEDVIKYDASKDSQLLRIINSVKELMYGEEIFLNQKMIEAL